MEEITAKQGEGAFEVHQDILTLKKQMGMAFVELGRLLKRVRDEGYYQVLGYDSFQSYVINSELGFKRRTAYYYIEIYEWYVEKLAYEAQYLAEVGQDKLLRALPIIKEEYKKVPFNTLRDKAGELLTEVQELRPVDFEKKYKDDRINEGHEEYLAPPEYVRCDKCGKWKIIIPVDDCCDEWLRDMLKVLRKRNAKK
jgi:hypothetical protein